MARAVPQAVGSQPTPPDGQDPSSDNQICLFQVRALLQGQPRPETVLYGR